MLESSALGHLHSSLTVLTAKVCPLYGAVLLVVEGSEWAARLERGILGLICTPGWSLGTFAKSI